MIAHIVLLKPRADLTDGQRDTIMADLQAAAARIPSIRTLRVGTRLRHGRPGYEQLMREDFSFLVHVEFEDLDGLTAYLAHPAHHAIGAHFVQSAAAALAYDYEMTALK